MTGPGDHPQPAWAGLAPGTVLDAVLEMLSPPTLRRRDLVAAVAACERQVSHLHALQCRLMAELTARDAEAGRDDHTRRSTTARDVGRALTLESALAAKRVALAAELAEDFPATLTALGAGRVTLEKAGVVAERLRRLKPGARAVVEAAALEHAPRLTRRQLHYWLDDAVGTAGANGKDQAN